MVKLRSVPGSWAGWLVSTGSGEAIVAVVADVSAQGLAMAGPKNKLQLSAQTLLLTVLAANEPLLCGATSLIFEGACGTGLIAPASGNLPLAIRG